MPFAAQRPPPPRAAVIPVLIRHVSGAPPHRRRITAARLTGAGRILQADWAVDQCR